MSEVTHTAAQQEAIQTLDRNVVVLASAGTGKTHVLVQRFLYLLEQRPQWPLASIVAITFTKKAAQQMRTRIRDGVQAQIRDQNPNPVWQQRLDELDHLQVSTVHSLCESILRTHALEAGLDPDFQVLDELEAERLQRQALDATFQDLEERDDACLALLDQYTLQDLRTTLASMLQNRSTLHTVLAGEDTLDWDQWHARCLDRIRKVRTVQWHRYRQQHPELAAAMTWLTSAPWRPVNDKMGAKVEPAVNAVRALQNGNWGAAISFLGASGLGRMVGGTKANWGSADALNQARAHISAVNKALKYLQAHSFDVQEPIDPREGPTLALWLQARALAEKWYQTLKQARTSLDFDDLELLTQRLLGQTDMDAASRVTRWRAHIHHVLVDEHQDINPVQQQIIDFLAPVQTPGQLFVVGDTKQSIYRFRQAQVTAFASLAEQLRRTTGKREVHLNRSFRSHTALVAATNHLFAHVLQPLDGKTYALYEAKPMALSSQQAAPSAEPCMELHVIHQMATGKPAHANPKLYEAQVLVQRIAQLQAAARPVRNVTGETRPLRLDDVAILMRSMGDLPLYEFVLRQARMPYQVIAGTALKHQPHIRSLLALLRYLDHPGDDFHLAVALRSSLFGLSDATLYRLVQATREQAASLAFFPCLLPTLKAQLDHVQLDRVQLAGAILHELQGQARLLPLDRLLQQVLDTTDCEAICLADPVRYRGARHLEDIQALRRYARQRADLSLGEFLDHFEEVNVRRVRTADEAAETWTRDTEEPGVRIMTIHGAKGLEFPVVCIPQLDRTLLAGSRTHGSPPMVTLDAEEGIACQLRNERGIPEKPLSLQAMEFRSQQMEYAETKRLFYVACTRAADLLVMTGRRHSKALGHRAGTNFARNWLTDVFAAFQLDPDDLAASRVTHKDFTGFRLRCYSYAPDQAAVQPPPRDRDRVAPCPLPDTPLKNMSGLSQMPERAVVSPYPQIPTLAMRRGTLAHNLLDPWDVWTALSPAALHTLAVQKARQLNIWTESIPRQLVAYLLALRATPEAQAITRSQVRVSEMPVLGTWEGRTRLLRLDLVYRDEQGGWNLVDWKTETLTTETREQVKQRHLPALAAYARAFHACTGEYPQTRLCFLSSVIRWISVSEAELLHVGPATDIEPDI